MKKILLMILCVGLVLSCAACALQKEPTTTQDTSGTTAPSTQATTAAPTTQAQSTTVAKADISFIYSGYWYQNDGNKILAMRFEKDGSVVVNTFRRKNLTASPDKPDSVIYGSFTDNGDGTLTVRPDNEFPEEAYLYTADSALEKLTYTKEDPQASEAQIELHCFNTLSKANAAKLLGNG